MWATCTGALVPFHVEEQAIDHLPPTRTRILMNVGNPEEAFNLAAIPCDGVGLARLEFIIANHIRVHPMALLRPEQVADPAERDGDRHPHRRLRPSGRLLRGPAGPGHGADRGGLLSRGR